MHIKKQNNSCWYHDMGRKVIYMRTKIASIQLWLSEGDNKSKRIEYVEKLIEQNSDADLILLPELWAIGWRSFNRYELEAETLEGEIISRIGEKAKKVNAYIHIGSMVEKKENGFYNTAVLLNPEGKIIAVYRKIHLVSEKGAEEVAYLTPGKKIVFVETELGKLGFSICYDIRFPELYRKMAVNHGVEIFLHVAAWPVGRAETWIELCHARATENLAYLISCNCAGGDCGGKYFGHSSIVDPYGISIASAGLNEAVIKGEIDVKELRELRKTIPHLQNRVLPV